MNFFCVFLIDILSEFPLVEVQKLCHTCVLVFGDLKKKEEWKTILKIWISSLMHTRLLNFL